MANRLAASTSPYLLQHAGNPVHWWPWSDEAFDQARLRDVPILLSVGYAACHWCHVMAHDSFEDEATAALMNDGFVNIKVDREERPDVDAVYMQATTALTGRGGWPMTCMLTHDGSPFFAGTFFPRAQFQALLASASQAWTGRRSELEGFGREVVTALAYRSASMGGVALPTSRELAAATLKLVADYDSRNGGFGSAPKFPPSMVLEFLLREHERTGDRAALSMVAGTCSAMARGGMYDQLAGGFARYSVDAEWIVPHFEKMLYDNALLLKAYLHWWRIAGDPLAERVSRETAHFLIADLGTVEGGFASALDADAAGVEGLTYAWTPEQLVDVLGTHDGARAAELLAVTAAGTFEHGASTLQLPIDPQDELWWQGIRRRLADARGRRPQPARDDKVVTAWNGLAIGALAEAGVLLNVPEFVAAAERAATLLLDIHWVSGRLRRTSRGGVVGHAAGVAEDYGDLADALLMLHQVTAAPRWLVAARELLDVALQHFADGAGGFFDTADDAEQLIQRPRDSSDNAAPCGLTALANALLSYSALTGSMAHREHAEQAVRAGAQAWLEQPRFGGWGLASAQALLDGPRQVAIVGESRAAERPLTGVAWRQRPPGAVVISAEPGSAGIPLVVDRLLVNERPAAYVCRGMVCDLPVGSAEELTAVLAR